MLAANGIAPPTAAVIAASPAPLRNPRRLGPELRPNTSASARSASSWYNSSMERSFRPVMSSPVQLARWQDRCSFFRLPGGILFHDSNDEPTAGMRDFGAVCTPLAGGSARGYQEFTATYRPPGLLRETELR